MTKLYLRDVGSHPERDLEVTLFPDGELQFEADNGKYVHINIAKAGVEELLKFLVEESRPTKHAPDVVESTASVSISPASEVSASEADSTHTTTQVM